MTRTLLACFAHPDDESFGAGGVLAKYASEGANVYLICATYGEHGEISDPALATRQNLGQVRQAELEAAAEVLGVTELEWLGYRDSGMAGRVSNDNPLAYVQARDEEVVPRLVASIRRLKPNVIVTFDPAGAYGHPDHIAIHKHTVSAVKAAGNPNLYPDSGPPWTPDRLFFTALPMSKLAEMRDQLKAVGVDTSDFERPDMPISGQSDEEIDVILDVSSVLPTKRRAVDAHKTQMGPDNPFNKFPKEFVDEFMSTEYFTLGWGKSVDDRPAGDLFEGL
jgi:LmbE family N-acetylglucosaminyl deacetylase